jgi:hypothetical protein
MPAKSASPHKPMTTCSFIFIRISSEFYLLKQAGIEALDHKHAPNPKQNILHAHIQFQPKDFSQVVKIGRRLDSISSRLEHPLDMVPRQVTLVTANGPLIDCQLCCQSLFLQAPGSTSSGALQPKSVI